MLLLLSLQRVPSSSSTVQGASPACLAPLCLLSCVDSFDTAPPPYYPACLAPLCLLSGVNSFDTAPPPQDLLAGSLYTAPSPLTSDGVMGLDAQEAGGSLVHMEGAQCHGPGCSRSRRVTGSYGRSTGIEDLVEISREHGRSAVSMETMDSYGLTCKGGPSTATRRTKLKEQAQPRRGPSSRSMQMVTTQGLERQEPKELSLIKGGGAVSKESTPGHEEEEQCRRT
ncbi:hypothetical protein NDA11_000410 [Ustilago hordei]|nr:hypothetical protein NDA11_000410 [Ustilago hordei]